MALKLILACFVIACLITAEAARRPGFYYRRGRIPERQDVDSVEDYPVRRAPGRYWKGFLQRRGCIALGGTGCEGNNGKCCRAGNPYTGTMRRCSNKGSFSNPVYTCVN